MMLANWESLVIQRDYFSVFRDHNKILQSLGSLCQEFKPRLGDCQEKLSQNTTFKLTLRVNPIQNSRDNFGQGNSSQNPVFINLSPTTREHWSIFLGGLYVDSVFCLYLGNKMDEKTFQSDWISIQKNACKDYCSEGVYISKSPQ